MKHQRRHFIVHMAADITTLIPVDSLQHVHILRKYRKLLQSTLGPEGSYKAVVTGGGYLEVTSSSALLITRLEMENPVCNYINHLASGLPDHGLYCGILLSHLLEQQWQQSVLTRNKTERIIDALVKKLRTFLLSEKICVKVEFDSINSFLPLVRTIILSKGSVLSGMDVNSLCVEIVKVFLNSVDEETNLINKVYISVESGSNTFTSCKGLVYNISENYNLGLAKELSGRVKIIVFTLKLENKSEESCSIVNKVKIMLDHAILSGIKIVACQKTVVPEIKLFLRRRKIVLMERMGSDLTKMLINTSQAFPISDVRNEETDIVKLTGHLSSTQVIHWSGSDYLVLYNEKVPVGTLLVQSCSLLGQDFVKGLVQQAVMALKTVAAHPVLTLGGGCLETWLIGQIHLLKEAWKEKEFHIVSTWVQHAFRSTCYDVDMDSVYHHSWREGGDVCGCRLVTREEVEHGGGVWFTLTEVISCQVILKTPLHPNMKPGPDTLLEAHQQKSLVIFSALEAFANLGDVGLIAYKV